MSMLLARQRLSGLLSGGATKASLCVAPRLPQHASTAHRVSGEVCSVRVRERGALEFVRGLARGPGRSYVWTAASTNSPSPEPEQLEVELKVGGMMCEGCTSRVQEALQKCDSVARVEVSLEKANASVWVNSGSQLDALSLANNFAETVRAIGFEATPHIDGL